MKTISYKDNNIIPKVGDDVVFRKVWFSMPFLARTQEDKYDTLTVFGILAVNRQKNMSGEEDIYVCTIKYKDITRVCGYDWLKKVESGCVEKKERGEEEEKEFTTIEQDMMNVLIGPE